MTISSQTRKVGPFAGNDTTTVFPFDFKVFQAEDMLVIRSVDATGVETDLVLDADYTVTLNADQNANPGGNITLPAALATGTSLVVTSELPYLQQTDLTNQGGFYPNVVTNALDRLTIFVQQMAERLRRSLSFPISDSGAASGVLPGENQRAGTVLAFDDNGSPVVGPRVGDVGTVLANIAKVGVVADNIVDVGTVADSIASVNVVATNIEAVVDVGDSIANVNAVAGSIADVQTVADNIVDVSNFAEVYYGPSAVDPATRRNGTPLQDGDLYFNTDTRSLRTYSVNAGVWVEGASGSVNVYNFSGDGVTTAFNLPIAPSDENVTQVYISGVYQQKNVYTVVGTVLALDAAPPVGVDNIEVVTFSVLPLGVTDSALVTFPGGRTVADLADDSNATHGDAMIAVKQPRANAKVRTQHSKNTEVLSIMDFDGVVGDGVADDRAAIQAAFDTLTAGEKIVFPFGYTWKVVNAVGTGADLTAQRADAVVNGTLYAITCSKDYITVVIDGRVNAMSGIDDLFRFTGKGVKVVGRGSVHGPGVYHDVNSQDETLQWRPSLVRVEGNYSEVNGLRLEEPVTIAIHMLGSFQKSTFNAILGGPLSHSPEGTVMFAIQSGPHNGGGEGNVMSGNFIGRSSLGGAVYTGIMNLAPNSVITGNVCMGVLEHGAYNYGADCVISGNSFDGLSDADPMIAAGIQVFAPGNTITGNNLGFCQGGILLQACSDTVVSGNVIRLNGKLGGISVRRYYSEATTVKYENITITGNVVNVPNSVQQAIDVALDCNLQGLKISGNTCVGGAATYGSIVVRQYGDQNISNVQITDNYVSDAQGLAIEVDNIFLFKITGNQVINANAGGANSTAIMARTLCRYGEISDNTAYDSRTTKLTTRVVHASGAGNLNIRAERNVGVTLSTTSIAPLVAVPAEGGYLRGNSHNGEPTRGKFTVDNSNGAAVTTAGIRDATAAEIRLHPINKAAWDLQASANRIFVASVGSTYFNWNTSSAAATGGTTAQFEYEIVQ